MEGKITQLTERGTGTPMWPQTLAEGVLMKNGGNAEDAIAASARQSFDDMWDSACKMQGQTTGYCGAVPLIGGVNRDKGEYTICDTIVSYDEARQILIARKPFHGTNMEGAYHAGAVGVRAAFFPLSAVENVSTRMMFKEQSRVRVIQVGQYNARLATSNAQYMFDRCKSLEEIRGRLEILNNSNQHAFDGCVNLKRLYLRIGLMCSSISFEMCPELDLGSLTWIINDRLGNHAVTVTVHPDVFAKLTDETNAEWSAVLAKAAEKNITFATL